MTGPLDGVSTERRRTFLQLVGATAGVGAIRTALDVQADTHESIVMEQGDRCVQLQALSGDEPVEELYDYTYPVDRYEGSPGSDGYSFSSEGTTALQRDRTSILFLYDGPEGLSLVVVHGHSGGDRDEGGTVSFTVSGLPDSATWVVRDDYYLEDGEQADTNDDRWDVDGDVHAIDWAYAGGRTDGGAVRDLGSVFEVTIDPAFNDDATLAAVRDFGPIEAWEVLSGDMASPERFPLRLDQPVTIRTGTCVEVNDGETVDDEDQTDEDPADDGQTDDESTDEESTDAEEQTTDEEVTDETSTDDEATTDDTEVTDEAETDDTEVTDGAETDDTEELSEDEGRSKHERKQRKHQEKHERKQRKHQKKHERKQRKHQKKHERKQRKHQEKHERKQRKHRKHDD